MNDDEDFGPLAKQDEHELLLYDFFKYVTSLVLLTLGGLLIVMKDFDPKDVKPSMVIVDIMLISMSGVLAFSGASEIARSRYTGKAARRSLQLSRVGAPALLAAGIGLFLAMFVDSLT